MLHFEKLSLKMSAKDYAHDFLKVAQKSGQRPCTGYFAKNR